MKRHYLLGALALIAFFGVGTWLFFHYDLHVFFSDHERAVEMITSYDPYDEIIFIALQILQVVFAPIPGEASGFIGGYLYGPILGTIYSTIGLTIGSWIAFLLAHVFGLPLVERIVSPETLRKYDYVLEHKGVFIVFFLFLIPGLPKDFLCYILGLSHMRLWTFLDHLHGGTALRHHHALHVRELRTKQPVHPSRRPARHHGAVPDRRLFLPGKVAAETQGKSGQVQRRASGVGSLKAVTSGW